MKRTAALAASAACIFSATANAQDDVPLPPRSDERATWSFVLENDYFANTDRNYTNGIRLEWVAPEDEVSRWLTQAARTQPFVNLKGARVRQGFALAHTLYTASDITLENPPLDDHPYAAHLNVNWFASARTPNRPTAMRDGSCSKRESSNS